MEPMQEMAKLYLDWWEQVYSTNQTIENAHDFWSTVAKEESSDC